MKYFEQPESNIEVLIKEAIDSVTPDDFKEQMNHVKVMEKRYWVQDVTKEDEFEKFITDLGLTSEDSEQSSDDHDDIEDV
uniref:Uncharacterized protein n=1 Tax=Pararge aegeria TaxID=116150 RepID=S4P7Q8_9NEOP